MSIHSRVQALFDWLVDGAPGATTPARVLARVGLDLNAAGVPVARAAAFVRTLHPHIAGRRFVWKEGLAEAEISELRWDETFGKTIRTFDQTSAAVTHNPLGMVFTTGVEVRSRLEGSAPLEYAALEDLRTQGLTDYLGAPLKFMGGQVNAVTFATFAPGGFTDEQLSALRFVVRPLSRVAETLALMRTAVNLLDTYVGHGAGDRILNGHIQLGDIEAIRCVIWFSDLRGFTSLSGERTPAEIITVLNDFFECQVPAIDRHGGEVLKFIGDGLLAIFPITQERDGAAAAEAGVTAAQTAFAALHRLNQTRATRGEGPLQFGVALHAGEVAFGNIGGASRLDFTAIGPAVNLASRIETLTGKLGKQLLLSQAVAQLLTQQTRCLGSHEVKGLLEPQPIYELSPG